MKLGTLLRIPINGRPCWRLYAGWGSDTGRIATADVSLGNWLSLRRCARDGKPRAAERGYRFHDGTAALLHRKPAEGQSDE